MGGEMRYRLLIVEDDKVIAGEMKRHLEKWGYEVFCAEDFGNVTAEFAACTPQLVLMDIGLPFFNGYYWCAQIRQISQVPIIFVSSAGDNMNIVMAVNMGGDDFLVKPFEPEVLSAKVQAMLRRTYAFRGQTSVMECGGLILNLTDASLLVRWTAQNTNRPARHPRPRSPRDPASPCNARRCNSVPAPACRRRRGTRN